MSTCWVIVNLVTQRSTCKLYDVTILTVVFVCSEPILSEVKVTLTLLPKIRPETAKVTSHTPLHEHGRVNDKAIELIKQKLITKLFIWSNALDVSQHENKQNQEKQKEASISFSNFLGLAQR